MAIQTYLDQQLVNGRSFLLAAEAIKAMPQSPEAFETAARRLVKKQRLVSPWRGFFLHLRPEERIFGAPEPIRWIDPFMRYLGLDYRISLLSAAAFHGSSHQAAMVFQVIAPRQLHPIKIGRHRIQFIYQRPEIFAQTNRPELLSQIKSEAGYAKAAGIELLLLDSIRYVHSAAGLDGVAQIVHDLGRKANPSKLRKAAAAYENSVVRRLGYLLGHFGFARQSESLLPYVKEVKSMKPLDPSTKPLVVSAKPEINEKWQLILNRTIEIDS